MTFLVIRESVTKLVLQLFLPLLLGGWVDPIHVFLFPVPHNHRNHPIEEVMKAIGLSFFLIPY